MTSPLKESLPDEKYSSSYALLTDEALSGDTVTILRDTLVEYTKKHVFGASELLILLMTAEDVVNFRSEKQGGA